MDNHRFEKVILVDEQDNVIGYEEKLKAHQLGLLHRAFSVFIFRRHQGVLELLIQQRNLNKYHCGGLWTNTCCSHPREGETVIAAGERRLLEEMGYQAKLQAAGTFIYCANLDNQLTEYELDHVLVGLDDGQSFQVAPEEVMAYRWVAVETLPFLLETEPRRHTPWFGQALDIAVKYLDKIGFIQRVTLETL